MEPRLFRVEPGLARRTAMNWPPWIEPVLATERLPELTVTALAFAPLTVPPIVMLVPTPWTTTPAPVIDPLRVRVPARNTWEPLFPVMLLLFT